VTEGHVKVKLSRNGICGTDLHEHYDGPIFIPESEPHPLTGKTLPVVIGHEFSGIVTEGGVGDECSARHSCRMCAAPIDARADGPDIVAPDSVHVAVGYGGMS
jgi:threonine dehydrogenase-like Zn-dependent dehydrogenase